MKTIYRKKIKILTEIKSDNNDNGFRTLILSSPDISVGPWGKGTHPEGRDIFFTKLDGTSVLKHKIRFFEPIRGILKAEILDVDTIEPTNELYVYYGHYNWSLTTDQITQTKQSDFLWGKVEKEKNCNLELEEMVTNPEFSSQYWQEPDDAIAKAISESLLEVALGEYLLSDQLEFVKGEISARWHDLLRREIENELVTGKTGFKLKIKVKELGDDKIQWFSTIELSTSSPDFKQDFQIPLNNLSGGYYQLDVSLITPEGKEYDSFESGIDPYHPSNELPLMFCIRTFGASESEPEKNDFLSYSTEIVKKLINQQSRFLGDDQNRTKFLTVSDKPGAGYLSLGIRQNGEYHTVISRADGLEYCPERFDLQSCEMLYHLTEITGTNTYSQLADAMLKDFGQYGFDSESGLGFLGVESGLNVKQMNVTQKIGKPEPHFKPHIGVPIDLLWKKLPEQTARMLKSSYYGLITRPETMDYNRYCMYGFDDTEQVNSMEFNPGHLPFASSGACLIHWWSSLFARTNDQEALEWAQKMFEKWNGLQHPESGLIPYYYYPESDTSGMIPTDFVSIRSAATAAKSLIYAYHELKNTSESDFSEALKNMGLRIAEGLAEFSYDEKKRIFPEYLSMDGSRRLTTDRYTFRTQEDKNEAMKRDPSLEGVLVFEGTGFFQPGMYHLYVAGSGIPYDLAWIAWQTENRKILSTVINWADIVMEEAGKLDSAFNNEGKWTFPASAQYIKMFVYIYQVTRESKYLVSAQELANRELTYVDKVFCPEWWRMPERNDFLEALLILHKAVEATE